MHASFAIRELGLEAIMVNCNPETEGDLESLLGAIAARTIAFVVATADRASKGRAAARLRKAASLSGTPCFVTLAAMSAALEVLEESSRLGETEVEVRALQDWHASMPDPRPKSAQTLDADAATTVWTGCAAGFPKARP